MGCTEDLVAEHARRRCSRWAYSTPSPGAWRPGSRSTPGTSTRCSSSSACSSTGATTRRRSATSSPRSCAAGAPGASGPGRALLARARGRPRARPADARGRRARYEAGEPDAGRSRSETRPRPTADCCARHIRREDDEIFPIGGRDAAGRDASSRSREAYDAVERDVVGEGRHEAFHEMLHRQRDRYLARAACGDAGDRDAATRAPSAELRAGDRRAPRPPAEARRPRARHPGAAARAARRSTCTGSSAHLENDQLSLHTRDARIIAASLDRFVHDLAQVAARPASAVAETGPAAQGGQRYLAAVREHVPVSNIAFLDLRGTGRGVGAAEPRRHRPGGRSRVPRARSRGRTSR